MGAFIYNDQIEFFIFFQGDTKRKMVIFLTVRWLMSILILKKSGYSCNFHKI